MPSKARPPWSRMPTRSDDVFAHDPRRVESRGLLKGSPSSGERAVGRRSAGTTWPRTKARSATKVVAAGS
eukprot:4826343-Lingulodinium_polyedra.AAC.1